MKQFYSFRDFHLLKALEEFDKESFSLDFSLNCYFKSHKQLGSNDKRYISDVIYELIRWREILDFYGKNPSWEERLSQWKAIDFRSIDQSSLPAHIRLSFPHFYFELLINSFGREKALEIASICNSRAPTTVRVNLLKTTRDHLINLWKDKFSFIPCLFSPTGIQFQERVHLHSLAEFKAGFFEIQDEGSQQIASLVQIKPKEHFLDFCAGSGGKTLAIAPLMQNKGQIYLYDVRPSILFQAKKRLKRAGIQNAQILFPMNSNLHSLRNRMDWILADVPCSGSGTLRRNPDMKWKFSPIALENLIKMQRDIFANVLSFARPKGKIVYATCSLLKEENEDQVEWFLKHHLVNLESIHRFEPLLNGRDGFFGAIFSKN